MFEDLTKKEVKQKGIEDNVCLECLKVFRIQSTSFLCLHDGIKIDAN